MSVTSSTAICNLALDLVQGDRVSDISSPQTPIEELCARWYDHTRRKLLRQHPWNFAIKRVILAASVTAPVFGSDKKFPVPADFLRLLHLMDEDSRIIATKNYQFEDRAIMVEDVATSVRMVYIADEEDVTKFDDLFVDLMAVELALSIAFKVTQSNSDFERLAAMRKTLIVAAKSIDGQERPPESRVSSNNRRVRMYLGSRAANVHGF